MQTDQKHDIGNFMSVAFIGKYLSIAIVLKRANQQKNIAKTALKIDKKAIKSEK